MQLVDYVALGCAGSHGETDQILAWKHWTRNPAEFRDSLAAKWAEPPVTSARQA